MMYAFISSSTNYDGDEERGQRRVTTVKAAMKRTTRSITSNDEFNARRKTTMSAATEDRIYNFWRTQQPPVSEKRLNMTCNCWPSCCCCCCGGSRKSKPEKKGVKYLLGIGGLYGKTKKSMGKSYSKKSTTPAFDPEEIEKGLEGFKELEKSSRRTSRNGSESPVFITSTLMEDDGIPEGINSTSLIKEAIHVMKKKPNGKKRSRSRSKTKFKTDIVDGSP
ncbi:cellulose synthase (UDP-forming), partial [Sarracenia purpurea var. burkii]